MRSWLKPIPIPCRKPEKTDEAEQPLALRKLFSKSYGRASLG